MAKQNGNHAIAVLFFTYLKFMPRLSLSLGKPMKNSDYGMGRVDET
jgi:hypothetical protein